MISFRCVLPCDLRWKVGCIRDVVVIWTRVPWNSLIPCFAPAVAFVACRFGSSAVQALTSCMGSSAVVPPHHDVVIVRIASWLHARLKHRLVTSRLGVDARKDPAADVGVRSIAVHLQLLDRPVRGRLIDCALGTGRLRSGTVVLERAISRLTHKREPIVELVTSS